MSPHEFPVTDHMEKIHHDRMQMSTKELSHPHIVADPVTKARQDAYNLSVARELLEIQKQTIKDLRRRCAGLMLELQRRDELDPVAPVVGRFSSEERVTV